MDVNALAKQLAIDEGYRQHAYLDTVGVTTIGIGRAISKPGRGLSRSEAEILLRNDIALAMHDLDVHFPWWRRMSEARQQAISNMMFNLGLTRFSGFKDMIAALKREDYLAAAKAATSSKWYTQVGPRAERIVATLRGESVVDSPALP